MGDGRYTAADRLNVNKWSKGGKLLAVAPTGAEKRKSTRADRVQMPRLFFFSRAQIDETRRASEAFMYPATLFEQLEGLTC